MDERVRPAYALPAKAEVVPPAPGRALPPSLAPVERENALDRAVHANIAGLSGGFSPMALALAATDWGLHLAASPGRRADLLMGALSEQAALLQELPGTAVGGEPSSRRKRAEDRRFRAEEWQNWPFSLYADSFLAAERCWDEATSQIHGATRHHLALLNFAGRQALDSLAPSNFLLTNPVALKQTLREKGVNLIRGAINYATDIGRLARGERSDAEKAFKPGDTVAVTKGVVVRRTKLAEIIQYSPTTATVRAEPVVITPAWIMKYYILDLSPQNSLIRHLVDSGLTVFCISWRNPTADDRDIGFDDYRAEGVSAAIDAALAISGASRAHLVGYCIGGTLAAIAAASMARDNDDRIQSLTLFAAQMDFEDGGELRLFIDESQLALLEDVMWKQGTLESKQMAGTFDLMRSNDLIWSRAIHHYLMGEPGRVDDLAAWSSDATRMPYKMHSEYLRELYLDNDLAEGRFRTRGSVGRAARHPRADLRCRSGTRPCRSLALGVQDSFLDGCGHHFCARQRRPQPRDRRAAGPGRSSFSHRHDGGEGFSPRSRGLGRGGGIATGILVAGLVRLAGRPFQRQGRAAAARLCGLGPRAAWASARRICSSISIAWRTSGFDARRGFGLSCASTLTLAEFGVASLNVRDNVPIAGDRLSGKLSSPVYKKQGG